MFTPENLAWVSAILAMTAPGVLLVQPLFKAFGGSQQTESIVRNTGNAAWIALGAACIAAGLQCFTTKMSYAGVLDFWIYLDEVSLSMMLLVGFLGAIILRYSRNYLAGDPEQGKFMLWMSTTIASVMLLVISGNLILFFTAWLATSLSLHQLLVFYPNRPGVQLPARKKFILSRLGDVCLLISFILIWNTFGALDFKTLFDLASASTIAESWSVLWIGLLLVAGALLKSAQFPFHSWLPDTMESPTPVSALMHAGIINGGGFLIIRLSPVVTLSQTSLFILAVVGAVTALFASVVMLTQTNVKQSLAYSTIAQMGFMMLQCGLGAFALALLHIIAHSLYKAHAFLRSGSVVEHSKAAWVPKGIGQPHPILKAVLLVLVTVGTFAVASFFGMGLNNKTGVVVLGVVLMFGLSQLAWNAFTPPIKAGVLARVAALMAGVTVLYFLVHEGAVWLFGSSVADVPPVRPGDAVVYAIILLLFGAVMIFQSLIAYRKDRPGWRALYVHASNGFYLGALFNYGVERVWPVKPPRAPEFH